MLLSVQVDDLLVQSGKLIEEGLFDVVRSSSLICGVFCLRSWLLLYDPMTSPVRADALDDPSVS